MTETEQDIAAVIATAIKAALAPIRDENEALRRRIVDLEMRAPQQGPAGPQGLPGKDGAVGPQGEKGERGEIGTVGPAGPQGEPGENGRSIVGEKGEPGERGEPGLQGPEGPRGLQGEVGPAGAAGAVGATGERGERGLPGEPGAAGKDGVSVVDALIDVEGRLVLMLSDGTVRTLARVVGRDGATGPAGANGKDGLDGKDGKDGANGRDGQDGIVSLDTFEAVPIDERSFGFVAGEDRKPIKGVIRTDAMLYRGVWREGTSYEKGDGVTWAGSMWFARNATSEKPGAGATAWQLAVKCGRDGAPGKEGKQGPQGPRGEVGSPGRNYVG